MPKGIQQKGMIRMNKMLHAAVSLFIENGYEKTTTASIAKAAGMAPSSFFAAFESKEALLLTLVKAMFEDQFTIAERMAGPYADKIMLYGVETAIQMHIVEISEPMRDMYVTAYSLPSTSEYIYRSTSERLALIFAEYMPTAAAKDFYEIEIASAGITRAFMARRCDMYFTMESKLSCYLDCCMTLYSVPRKKRAEVIAAVLKMDIKQIAEKVLSGFIEKAESGLEKVLPAN